MAFRTQKISQMTPKGANLEGTDLLEVSTLESGSYVTRSITGQEIIDAAAGSGVTDVTATAPLVSTGGTTPNISIDQADGTQDGYLSIADWNTFNDKQNGLTLTTTGTSGPATLIADVLNIPQYSGGGGLKGVHTIRKIASGESTCAAINAFASTGQSTTANRLTLAPYYPATDVNSVSISINIATAVASALVRVLIYSNVDGKPNTKLYESSDLDASTTGIKTALNNFSFVSGTTYWIGLHSNLASINITAIPQTASILLRQSGVFNGSYTYAVSSIPLGSAPTIITTGSLINANPFLLQINA